MSFDSTFIRPPQTYTYDSLNRIKDATENLTPSGGSSTQTWKQTFTYDRYGNRSFDEGGSSGNYLTTTLTRNCSTSSYNANGICDKKKVNPTFASTNRIVKDQDGDTVNDYDFDNAGNTTKDADSRTFIYDAENKQIEVKNSSSQTIGQYWYDGDGKRVKKYVPSTGETTIFVYDASGKMVAEYSTIVETTNPQVSYLTNDHLGSPRINTDQNGLVTARHDYHPFGEEILTSERTAGLNYADDSIRQQFTSYERDNETDLDFAKARTYAYYYGRFTTPDDFSNDSDIQDPQSWNKYMYVRNNPLNLIDPTGKKGEISVRTDEKNKTGTIVIRAKFAIYTYPGSNVDLQKQKEALQNQIKNAYSGEFTKNGIKYTVSAEIDVQVVDNESAAVELGKAGKVDNIVGVCDCKQINFDSNGEGSDGPADAVSYGLKNETFDRMVVAIGADPGNSNNRLYAHEFGHLLGVTEHLMGQNALMRGGRVPRPSITQDDGELILGKSVSQAQRGVSVGTDRWANTRQGRIPLPPSPGLAIFPVRAYQYNQVKINGIY